MTLFDHSQRLIKYDGVSKSVNKAECQSLVGSLVYAAVATRPDISYSVEYQISTNYDYMRTLLCLIVGGFELAGGVDIFLNFSKVGGGS